MWNYIFLSIIFTLISIIFRYNFYLPISIIEQAEIDYDYIIGKFFLNKHLFF